jgi:hypothetical protein
MKFEPVASTKAFRLALIGGGPSCTYALERLAATRDRLPPSTSLQVHVFDKGGLFGAGAVHSPHQTATSFLNRIVGQVAFAADETVTDSGPLLPADLRPTLYEWCQQQFLATGNPIFDLQPEDWPKRYVHGLALQHQFDRYVHLLRSHPAIEVELHAEEVVDIARSSMGLTIACAPTGSAVTADHVLLVTGHSTNDPRKVKSRKHWAVFSVEHSAQFVSSAYPLENAFGPTSGLVTDVIGCLGMGLTTIDIILFLTEGRGGRFVHEDGRMRYVRSGNEPQSIVPFSEAGVFTFARPFNAKEENPAELEHVGDYLTEDAIDQLRLSVGTPMSSGDREQRQLDFERHVFPLIILEMACLYYSTLLGPEFRLQLVDATRHAYRAFLDGEADVSSIEAAIAGLMAPVDVAVDRAEAVIDALVSGEGVDFTPTWGPPILVRYLEVVFGAALASAAADQLHDPRYLAELLEPAEPPSGHSRRLSDNRFSWQRMIDPLGRLTDPTPGRYRDALIAFMRTDHLWAAQNNLDNPAKAAADGVWRDLRPVLGYAVDHGGLSSASHRRFLDVYMRHHNRLANGAALEVMEKVLALVEDGIVDVSIGPSARIRCDEELGKFVVEGPVTQAQVVLDVLVDASVHSFDPAVDTSSLYPNLLERGIVRKWKNPTEWDVDGFEPGGLDLTDHFHPIDRQGRVERRMSFLGPPSEGRMFFQLGALRPGQNHHVMQDVLAWLQDFWGDVEEAAGE